MAFVIDNPYWFKVVAHVNERTFEGLWECTLVSEVHCYDVAYLRDDQLCRVTPEDELVIELYAREWD